MSASKVNQVVDKFKSSIDTTNDYSIKDLTKILEGVYKEVYGNKKRSSSSEKKPPSAYNLFVKAEIEKIIKLPSGFSYEFEKFKKEQKKRKNSAYD